MDQTKTNPQTTPAAGQPAELLYTVMPKEGNKTSSANVPRAPGSPPPPPPPPVHSSASKAKVNWTYAFIGLLAVAILAGSAYYLLGRKREPEVKVSNTKLPKTFFLQYFQSEDCTNQTICGDDVDADNDGLTNYDEFKAGTNPTLADTDMDGLADGDELHIFKTEPTQKFTKGNDKVASDNDWTDGVQIKNQYDPFTPRLKFTDLRKQQIADDTGKYSLHEPTPGTLTPESEPAAESIVPRVVTVTIEDGKFDPSSVLIKQGDTVQWVNKDTKSHHIASNPHPTHTDLAELESSDLAAGQNFQFKFIKIGTFDYHDHLDPTIKGSVVVK